MDPKSLFSLSDHLDSLSKEGDPLKVLQQTEISNISGRGRLMVSATAMAPRVGGLRSIW